MTPRNILSHLLVTILLLIAGLGLFVVGLGINHAAATLSGATTTTSIVVEDEQCFLFDGEVASNLITAGYNMDYHSNGSDVGYWFMNEEYLGSAAAEDATFSACARAEYAEAIEAAQP